MFKVGGHRPDSDGIEYNKFSSSLFGSHPQMFTGDADLRPFSSPRHNQKQTSTCAAQSTIKALEIKRIQKYGLNAHIPLSVLDLYYGARDLMSPKETHVDEGTHLYLTCEVLKRFGVCREELNPFKEENIFKPTPVMATRESYMNKIQNSFRITSLGNDRVDDVIKNLRMGNPIVFGTLIGDSWFDYSTKSEPLNVIDPSNAKGGHATTLVGWVNGTFVDENSWDTSWGHDGFAYLRPEVIASNTSSDFWVIVEGSEAWIEK